MTSSGGQPAQGAGGAVTDPAPAPDAESGWTIESFCEAYVERMDALCEWRARCCGTPEAFVLDACGASVEACVEEMQFTQSMSGAEWNGSVAKTCVDSLVSHAPQDCNGVPRNLEANDVDYGVLGYAYAGTRGLCNLIFYGTAPLGGSCQLHTDCQKGLLCDEVTAQCVAPLRVGEQCGQPGVNCEAGLVCVEDTVDVSTCHESPPGAEVCSGGDGPCPPGTQCLIPETEPFDRPLANGTCEPPIAIGEHCNTVTGTMRCAGDAFCNAEDVCEPRLQDGMPCTGSPECLGQCNPTLGVCESVCGGSYRVQ